MKIRVRVLGGLLLLLAAVLAVGGAAWLRGSRPGADARPASSVRVQRGRFVRSLLVSGELVAAQSVRVVAPPFRGRGPFSVKALAPEGSHVRPGDLLVQIDNSSLVTDLQTAELNLEKADNELVKKQAELEIQVKDLELELGQKKLELEKAQLKVEIPKDLISLRDWQDNQFTFQKARKEHDKTLRALELAGKASGEEVRMLRVKRDQSAAQVERLRSDIAAFEIRADRSGTVLYEIFLPSRWDPSETPRKLQVGDQVFQGWSMLSLPDLERMEVRAAVSEVDGGFVRPGQRVRVVADAHPHREFAGVVEHVPALAERSGKSTNVRVFTTTVKLETTDANLMRPGMSVRAEIVLGEEQGPKLPRRAVFEEDDKAFVRTAGGGKTEIRVLARNALECLVDGIAEGVEVEP